LKIWFDILTPKQVMFFHRAIGLLRRGHEVLCTTRGYREAEELAELKGLQLERCGRHGGADRYDKLRESANRMYELATKVRNFEPDVAVTFSSPEGARVAFGLGIKHVGFNDSPHAIAVAKLTIPLMDRLLCPSIIPKRDFTQYGITEDKITQYDAIDPVAWLKNYKAPEKFQPLPYVDPKKKTILIRMEESKASYIVDKGIVWSNVVDEVIRGLAGSANIVILCRYDDQILQMKRQYGKDAKIIEKVVDGTKLIESIDLFIGEGGTMTAEAALMGKPTISFPPFPIHVEEFLVEKKLIRRVADIRQLPKLCISMMNEKELQKTQRENARKLLTEMEDPTDKMMAAIQST
jgi:hypothetical protein